MDHVQFKNDEGLHKFSPVLVLAPSKIYLVLHKFFFFEIV